MRTFVLMLCSLGAALGNLSAHNLQIKDVSCDQHFLHLTISWDHAWHLEPAAANLHDAVWLFAKIKEGGGEWRHCHFATDRHQTSAPEVLGLDPGAAGEGIMLKYLPVGAGNVSSVQMDLAWKEGLAPGRYEVRVFGIEMAWVPGGSFWLGDGASNFALHDSANGQPYRIDSENEIAADALAAIGGRVPQATIPEAFPKGYDGFYLMKHELSQSQYADFLNTLTYGQQRARTSTSPSSPAGTAALSSTHAHRNGMVVATPSVADGYPAQYGCNLDGGATDGESDGGYRACNGLAWPDLAAYLDWAALRPMTELEFEKACRGFQFPLPSEFAWGTDEIVDANTLLHDATAFESVAETATASAGLGSHGYAGPQGPLRCGFGAHGSSDRLQAGSGAFGHLELSGNLWELCVSVLRTGPQFQGNCGDGMLSSSGEANVDSWPGSEGIGYKGGGWNSGILPGFRDLAVSDRFYIDLAADVRRHTAGGRGCR
ncbi:MAG: hypothetical protein RLZZ165_1596 [Bacteroidota bacterium]|jgi:formylglycine-generating enzyme required for sulfatase activity